MCSGTRANQRFLPAHLIPASPPARRAGQVNQAAAPGSSPGMLHARCPERWVERRAEAPGGADPGSGSQGLLLFVPGACVSR